MPNGSLTPLGRQLRSALIRIGPSRGAPAQQRQHDVGLRGQCARLHAQAGILAAAATAAAAVERYDESERQCADPSDERHRERLSSGSTAGRLQFAPFLGRKHSEAQSTPRIRKTTGSPSRSQLNRRTRVDRLSQALQDAGHKSVVPRPTRKSDLSHVNVKSLSGRRQSVENAQRHLDDNIPSIASATERKLSRILATYIHQKTLAPAIGEAEWETASRLSTEDQSLLRSKGFRQQDLEAWTNITANPDATAAASALATLTESRGVAGVPIFLPLYVLRRPSISAQALRILVRQAWSFLDHASSAVWSEALSRNQVFLVFNRLIRHARIVWPAAMEAIVEILLHFLPLARCRQDHKHHMGLTYQLNKAMRLISLPTSLEPYKNSTAQLDSVIRVLQFMADQEPTMEVNREGYRAVILTQLSQPKSDQDRLWAELKALSWPPWKEDRTAVDADLTRESHGLSNAAKALQQMAQAGYAPKAFERVAGIYAGWDTDQTPTIQKRTGRIVAAAELEPDEPETALESRVWAARIDATRTIQEAWACYESYERTVQSPDMEVCLVTFEKLFQEQRRRSGNGHDADPHDHGYHQPARLWPGDMREISPLPPSTHLYTYTHRPPPSMHDFYMMIRQRRLILDDACLAFIVKNADSLRQGMRYLHDRYSSDHTAKSVLLLDDDLSISRVPTGVLAAYVSLLSRFSGVPMSSAVPSELQRHRSSHVTGRVLHKRKLNADHPLVCAIALCQHQQLSYRPAWNSILRALGNESSFEGLWALAYYHGTEEQQVARVGSVDVENRARGAILAYRLVRRVMALMHEMHLDLDGSGFQALCSAIENLAIGCWTIMSREARLADNVPKPLLSEVRGFMRVQNIGGHLQRLHACFRRLTGAEDLVAEIGPHLPRLLEVPGPAILHAYIRAMGWMADYEGLLETVRWMVKYSPELAVKRKRDRNGRVVMRRAITALRVFLERSWLPDERHMGSPLSDSSNHRLNERSALLRSFERLETPADQGIIDAARQAVESVEDWDGWPSDEEVEMYCRNDRFERLL